MPARWATGTERQMMQSQQATMKHWQLHDNTVTAAIQNTAPAELHTWTPVEQFKSLSYHCKFMHHNQHSFGAVTWWSGDTKSIWLDCKKVLHFCWQKPVSARHEV